MLEYSNAMIDADCSVDQNIKTVPNVQKYFRTNMIFSSLLIRWVAVIAFSLWNTDYHPSKARVRPKQKAQKETATDSYMGGDGSPTTCPSR